jgi:hypothetical protein
VRWLLIILVTVYQIIKLVGTLVDNLLGQMQVLKY